MTVIQVLLVDIEFEAGKIGGIGIVVNDTEAAGDVTEEKRIISTGMSGHDEAGVVDPFHLLKPGYSRKHERAGGERTQHHLFGGRISN